MLFIDGVQYSAEDVAERFNVPLAKIRKAPEFVINPGKIVKRKFGQSREISVPAGSLVPSQIFITEKGKKLDFRYAEGVNEVEKNDKWVKEYVPRKISFVGMGKVITEENEDLMVFMFLHPACKQSPFRNKNSKDPASWLFKDLDQEGTDEMAEIIELQKALTAITGYSGEPLRVVAKAFNIFGVDKMNDDSVRAQLVKVARNPHIGGPKEFNDKINSNTTVFRGLIQNGVDRGLFVMHETAGRKRWKWGQTDKKGMDIVEVYDNGVPEVQTLIEHILSKIQDYYPTLMSAHQTFLAGKTAEDFLSTQPKINLNEVFGQSAGANIGGGTDEVSDEGLDDFDDDFDTAGLNEFPDRLGLDDEQISVNGSTRGEPVDVEALAEVAAIKASNDEHPEPVSTNEPYIPAFLQPKAKAMVTKKGPGKK